MGHSPEHAVAAVTWAVSSTSEYSYNTYKVSQPYSTSEQRSARDDRAVLYVNLELRRPYGSDPMYPSFIAAYRYLVVNQRCHSETDRGINNKQK